MIYQASLYFDGVSARAKSGSAAMPRTFLRLLAERGALESLEAGSPLMAASGEEVEIGAYLLQRERWTPGHYAVKTRENDVELSIHLTRAEMIVNLMLRGAALRERQGRVLEEWTSFILAASGKLAREVHLGPLVGIGVLADYREVRPPHEHELFPPGSVADFVSLGEIDEELAEELDRHPPPADVEERGEGRLYRWIDSLDVPDEQIAAALARRSAWIASLPSALIQAGWNEAGDKQLSAFGLAPHEDLTLYDPHGRIGVLAVVPDRTGRLPTADVEAFAEWRRRETLPDGSPLGEAYVVLPSREAALRVQPQAVAAGLDGVVYPGDGGTLWNPFPPGEWQ